MADSHGYPISEQGREVCDAGNGDIATCAPRGFGVGSEVE